MTDAFPDEKERQEFVLVDFQNNDYHLYSTMFEIPCDGIWLIGGRTMVIGRKPAVAI